MPTCLRLLRHCARRAASRGGLDGREQQAGQQADDRDHDQKLDEREAPMPNADPSHRRHPPGIAGPASEVCLTVVTCDKCHMVAVRLSILHRHVIPSRDHSCSPKFRRAL